MTYTPYTPSPISFESRSADDKVQLPPAAGPLGAYAPWVRTGQIVMTSGQFPWQDAAAQTLAYKGRIGAELSPDDGYQACRIAGLYGLAQLKEAAGSLDRIKQVLRVEGTMQVADQFMDHPSALNGTSDLINDVLGERGRHSRMIYTNPTMPLDTPVLIVLWAELRY